MDKKIVAGIYLRISDDREGRELGVTRQREDCIALADRLSATVYDIYNDNDRAASRYSKKPRKDYVRLLADARAGKLNMVIAYTTGRLTRRPREHEDQIDLAQDLGVQFSYVRSPSFDLNTAAGRRIARILAASDAGEPDDISERVTVAKERQARKGLYLGGYRAYGFEGPIRDDNGILINRGRINVALVDAEVKICRECIERLITGDRCITVIRDLNNRGVPSPDGKQWTIGNFKRTMTRRRHVIFDPDSSFNPAEPTKWRGTLEHKGTEYEAVWPGLISQTEYRLMIAQLSERSQAWAHGLKYGRRYLCSGFIYCGVCGGSVIGSRRRLQDGNYVRRYRCKKFDNHGNVVGCGHVYRLADPLEAYVAQEALARLDTPEVRRALSHESQDSETSDAAAKLVALKRRRQEIIDELSNGEIQMADFRALLAASDEAIARAQAQLPKTTSHTDATAVLREVERIRDQWQSASLDWRRSLIQLVVERVELLAGGHSGTSLWNGWRFKPESVRIRSNRS
jgi:site-specific DNA recombinase